MSICIISPEANQDLEEIYNYLSSFSLDATARFLDAFEKKCNILAQLPRLGKSYETLSPELRGFPLDKYIIFYRPIQGGIEVARVVSGYRDLRRIWEHPTLAKILDSE